MNTCRNQTRGAGGLLLGLATVILSAEKCGSEERSTWSDWGQSARNDSLDVRGVAGNAPTMRQTRGPISTDARIRFRIGDVPAFGQPARYGSTVPSASESMANQGVRLGNYLEPAARPLSGRAQRLPTSFRTGRVQRVDFQADAADAVPPVVSPPVEPIPGLAGMLGDEEGDPGLVMPPGHVFACPRTWYAEADFVYLNRQSDEITLFGDNSKGMDRLGFELGGRLTVGRLRDCTEGFEFVYIGPHEWVQSETRVGALDSLNSRFVGAGGVNVSSFKFAERQWQRYESKLHSFELSRKWWGWDVISTSFGLRYMYIGEEIRHVSVDDTDGTGRFLIGTENNLVGPQLGFELFKPCGRFRS